MNQLFRPASSFRAACVAGAAGAVLLGLAGCSGFWSLGTTTTLAASSTSPTQGTAVTFTATVAPSAATGTVSFFDDTTSLGTGTVSAGTATFSTSTLSVANHTIYAVYNGDATYAYSDSAAVTITVSAN